MKITTNAVAIEEFDDYVDEEKIPLAVCVPTTGVTSNRQKRLLEKYYDAVTDKKGFTNYYCNVINPEKCKEMGYTELEKDGKSNKIVKIGLKKCEPINGKFVVALCLDSNTSVTSYELVKTVRQEVEKIKKEINAKTR